MIFQQHHIGFKIHHRHHILWLKVEIWTFYETIKIRMADVYLRATLSTFIS